jgi:hypothetical protein
VNEDSLTLAELMLAADRFCCRVEDVNSADTDSRDREELHIKIAQCRGFLAELQSIYDQDELHIRNPIVRARCRYLIMTLLWVAFYARHRLDRKLFRTLVTIEAGFTYLLSVAVTRKHD